MRHEVIKSFRDKENGRLFLPGQTFIAEDEKRAEDLIKRQLIAEGKNRRKPPDTMGRIETPESNKPEPETAVPKKRQGRRPVSEGDADAVIE